MKEKALTVKSKQSKKNWVCHHCGSGRDCWNLVAEENTKSQKQYKELKDEDSLVTEVNDLAGI